MPIKEYRLKEVITSSQLTGQKSRAHDVELIQNSGSEREKKHSVMIITRVGARLRLQTAQGWKKKRERQEAISRGAGGDRKIYKLKEASKAYPLIYRGTREADKKGRADMARRGRKV